jgi:hypothetical protein
MKFDFFDGVRIVMVHGTRGPAPEEWRDYLDRIARKDVTYLGLLVFTAGGAPDAPQRRALNQVLGGQYFARAIVHRSAFVRGVVAAASWFSPGVAAFEPGEWEQAAHHAGFRKEELPDVARMVRRLHSNLGALIPWLDGALKGVSIRPPDSLRAR